jgi:serine/threonine-protein kinase
VSEPPEDASDTRTVLAESGGALAFDYGRFAPGVVLVDRYRIIGLLGRGGMGEVYRADDLTLGQSVALKFLPAGFELKPGSLDRLLSEVRTARQVSHPNVCRVHDVGEAAGRRFISMEYIDGEDLSVLLRRIGRLPADKAIEIARQLCAGLAASHERGVMHRDLKPANIMLDGRGRVRITDFGLATALQAGGTEAGEVAGTPAYMAPEQLNGAPLSAQTDIYALGLVLFEIFTGKRFHTVSSVAQLRERHAEVSSTDLSTSDPLLEPAVARVIERCLESDPRRRPASCALVSASLPGGDPLAAAIAAGETPSPQLVAAANVQGALSPRIAVVLGLTAVVALGVVVAGHWNPPGQFGITRSVEVLSAQTRDLLAGLGYTTEPVDRAGGFAYRYTDWRDRSILESPRPWSALKALRPAAVYFWYREQPSLMSASEMGRLGLEGLSIPLRGVRGFRPTDPAPEPGSVYVERAPDGSLDTLIAWPVSPAAAPVTAPLEWSRLFREARLDMAAFTAAAPDAALALAGDNRRAWVRQAGDGVAPLRVEAAELAGRPVAFRVLSARTPLELGSTSLTSSGTRSSSATIASANIVGFLVLSYGGAAFFMRRNFRLGRGDRRGAARLAKITGSLVFVASCLLASAPLDSRIFGTFHGAAGVGLFAAAWCWAYYMAIEPFVRRQWPRMLVGWSRLMAGEWRDPQVGREVFVGGLAAIGVAVLNVLAIPVLARRGAEPQLTEEFFFRALDGVPQLAGALLQIVPWALFVSLMWMVLLLLLRRVTRNDLAAVVLLSIVTLGLVPPGQWPHAALGVTTNLIVLLVALRTGFLSLVTSVTVAFAIGSLPLSVGTPGFAGTVSWLTVAAVAVPMVVALYIALAGQSIFGSTADGD